MTTPHEWLDLVGQAVNAFRLRLPDELLALVLDGIDLDTMEPELREEAGLLVLDHCVFSGDSEGNECIAAVVADMQANGSPMAVAAAAVAASTWDLVEVVPKGKDGRVRFKSLTKGPLHAVDLPQIHEVDVGDQFLVRLVACPDCHIAIPLLPTDGILDLLPADLIADIAWGKPGRDEALRTLRLFLLAIAQLFASLPEDADDAEVERRLQEMVDRLGDNET
jgi:hypothetical protein